MAKTPIAVAIVEDNARYRKELAKFLGGCPEFTCTDTFGSAEEALAELPKRPTEVVLMDINLPSASGIECTARLKAQLPNLHILMLTVYEDTDSIFQALQAGATGYLLKRAHPDDIVRAIHDVRSGGSPMTGYIARKVVESFRQAPASTSEAENLSPREREILNYLAQGYQYKEIAAALDISYATVRTHIERVYQKLQVCSRAQAVAKISEPRRK
ncbi:LuxR family transcriptional regulator [Planctomycetaceae bacterium SCGC AG-212-D15]|nr:LuxR family transcriptional regulator [Planctomycetaceae bacterium SCGC AG-212-D15]